jgi:periplasmic divalent cation tolerance protein
VSDFVLVLTTFPVDGDVDSVARTFVDERLAACVNVLPPMRSIYRWKGAVESADEHQLVIKTTRARVPELEARLSTLHPYDVPEFLVLSADDGAANYLGWVSDSTEPEK